MKRISIALMTLAAALAAVSCQKEAGLQEQTAGRMTITAVAEQVTTPGLTKAEMAYKYDVLWQENDSICVKDATNTAIFKLVKGAGTTKGTFTGGTVTGDVKAYYPASLVNGEKLVWPAVQQNNQVAPMFCRKNITTDTEEFNFKSLGAVMQIVLTTPLKGITLKSISIEDGTKTMSGEFTVEKDSLAVISATDKAGITLDLGAGEAIGETAKYFNIAVPAGEYNDLTLTFTATDGSKCVMKSTTLPEIERNVVGKLTLCAPQFIGGLPAGALKGEFTVNASGKKVYFSQGNLYYDGSNWGFEEEQYYFRTYDGYGKCDKNGYSSSAGTASGHWGLFGWSTSATTYGMSTSIYEDDYLGDFIDWGTAIDSKGTWTTLSEGEDGEWRYLFDHHVNVWGTCNNVPGRFIAPDGFVGDESALSEAIKDWGSAQAAGIVFLPAAGSRDGSSMLLSVGEFGWYWSSSPCEIPGTAFYVSFSDWNVSPYPSTFRYEGMSVRLVTESCAPDHLPFVAVESVSLDKTELSLEVGATETLTATVLPDNATKKDVIWTSSGPAVATVDAEGKVTAVAEGTATITAISDGLFTATCTVTVNAAAPVPEGFVDLGLTSGIYWAEKNLGASNPEDYGTYFSWGDVTGQTPSGSNFSPGFSWSNTPFNGGQSSYSETEFNKVKDTACPNGILAQTYDAANNANKGRMPTTEEFVELFKECYVEWGTYNSVNGLIVYKAKEGDASYAYFNSKMNQYSGSGNTWNTTTKAKPSYSTASDTFVFFPAAGYGDVTGLYTAGSDGNYWSSSLDTGFTDYAYSLLFSSDGVYPQNNDIRSYGFSVRPVAEVPATGSTIEDFNKKGDDSSNWE